ncbi:21.5 kDa protein [Human mastadenovirus E]|uniref:E1B protein, small T-antigen n=6 Tax=Human mastadenovirus E TaxID=130308 RepID=Q2KSM8_ADE04|nr:21.5 kDa protein [Human adenovirus E4]AVQ69308.1 21.5 kDa protein [Human mastadenovirus E]BBH49096.1 21.5 kDa protein [Human adenovirus 4a]ANQ44026.1 control protein E1B 19K [Human adenovirus E4]AVQ69399.1 21.5 kDa protein [Human mastadenovirus E]
MEIWTVLEDFYKTRQLLENASNGVSYLWRFCFGGDLAKLVYRTKQDYKEQFDDILKECPGLFDALNLGHQSHFNQRISRALDFTTPGRTTAAVAFFAFVLDKWSQETHFSRDYQLDFLAVALWRAWKCQRLNAISGYLPVQPLDTLRILSLQQISQERQRRQQQQEDQEENPRAGLDPPAEEEE